MSDSSDSEASGVDASDHGSSAHSGVPLPGDDSLDELEKMKQAAYEACLATVATHLDGFLKERPRASYEAWISALHPENVRTNTRGHPIDHRFYMGSSHHRQLWNASVDAARWVRAGDGNGIADVRTSGGARPLSQVAYAQRGQNRSFVPAPAVIWTPLLPAQRRAPRRPGVRAQSPPSFGAAPDRRTPGLVPRSFSPPPRDVPKALGSPCSGVRSFSYVPAVVQSGQSVCNGIQRSASPQPGQFQRRDTILRPQSLSASCRGLTQRSFVPCPKPGLRLLPPRRLESAGVRPFR
mmetsp:Transcript_21107/g.46524  ORF Transcript_21107/g.46524 Transcript_21107/m.46524 type:complete len:294 (-) Transcript_21107:61-942(-)